MAPGHILQIFLWVTIQDQICIAQRIIVDEIIQLRPLRHGHIQHILFLLEQFLISPNERTEDYNRRIIDTFVNRIEITDTEMLIYFNLSEASASEKQKKFPVEQLFDWESSGPSGENRTHGLLNPIVLLSKTQWTLRYHLYAVSSNFKIILSFCFVRCQDVSFLLWSNCGQPTLTNDHSPLLSYMAQFRFSKIEIALFCLHELFIRRICQPCQ